MPLPCMEGSLGEPEKDGVVGSAPPRQTSAVEIVFVLLIYKVSVEGVVILSELIISFIILRVVVLIRHCCCCCCRGVAGHHSPPSPLLLLAPGCCYCSYITHR